jgi:hypothetical protein
MFVGGWWDGFRLLGGWWDGFRVLGLTPIEVWIMIVLVALVAIVVFGIVSYRRKNTVVGHKVYWE